MLVASILLLPRFTDLSLEEKRILRESSENLPNAGGISHLVSGASSGQGPEIYFSASLAARI